MGFNLLTHDDVKYSQAGCKISFIKLSSSIQKKGLVSPRIEFVCTLSLLFYLSHEIILFCCPLKYSTSKSHAKKGET